jgi:hypothetical protein
LLFFSFVFLSFGCRACCCLCRHCCLCQKIS